MFLLCVTFWNAPSVWLYLWKPHTRRPSFPLVVACSSSSSSGTSSWLSSSKIITIVWMFQNVFTFTPHGVYLSPQTCVIIITTIIVDQQQFKDLSLTMMMINTWLLFSWLLRFSWLAKSPYIRVPTFLLAPWWSISSIRDSDHEFSSDF